MKRALFLVCTAAFAGCVKAPPKLPTPDTVTLGATQTAYHDLSKVQVCDMDGKNVAGELDAVSGVFSKFLDQTAPQGPWTEEKLDLLDQGLQNLPRVVSVQERNLAAVTRCKGLKPALLVQDTLQRGIDLLNQTKQRLADGAQLLTRERQKLALERWKQQQVQAVKSAKDEWCPPKLKPWEMPEIYYAVEDETGRTIWLFCDGSKMVSAEGKMQLVPPPNVRHLRHTEKQYAAKTQVFPGDQIQHPPTVTGAGPQSATTSEGQ